MLKYKILILGEETWAFFRFILPWTADIINSNLFSIHMPMVANCNYIFQVIDKILNITFFITRIVYLM